MHTRTHRGLEREEGVGTNDSKREDRKGINKFGILQSVRVMPKCNNQVCPSTAFGDCDSGDPGKKMG